jgi:hypothetical protein
MKRVGANRSVRSIWSICRETPMAVRPGEAIVRADRVVAPVDLVVSDLVVSDPVVFDPVVFDPVVFDRAAVLAVRLNNRLDRAA